MKLHIIIAVHNCLSYTRGAIDSIKTKTPYKITIVDNGSTDGTSRWCEEQGIDCIRFESNMGVSHAWNTGIIKAMEDPECEYIFVPNNDVIFHPKTIDNLISFIDKTGYAMVTGSNQNGQIVLSQLNDLNPPDFDEHDLQPITDWRAEGPDFSCFMIKPSTIQKVGFFDENFKAYCEDQDLHIRLHLAGENARRVSNAPYFHFASMTIAENPGLGISSAQGAVYYANKWGAGHEAAMDGQGFKHPYNDQTKSVKYWKGTEKYGIAE